MSTFHDGAFHVRVPAHVEMNAFALQHVLKRPVQKFFSPIRLHPDRQPAYRLWVFWIWKNDVTEGPFFDSRGTTCRCFKNTPWSRRYIYWAPAVNQITFPNVHNIIHAVRIARKSPSNREIQSESILCFKPGSQFPAVFPIILYLAAARTCFKVEKPLGSSGSK